MSRFKFSRWLRSWFPKEWPNAKTAAQQQDEIINAERIRMLTRKIEKELDSEVK